MTYTARLKDLQESKYWLEPAHSHFRKYFEDKYLDQTFLKVNFLNVQRLKKPLPFSKYPHA